jgi:hypothetical protein
MSTLFGRLPETFRLPRPGETDPTFGLSRSAYYDGEESGYWQLIRIIQPGKTRGITLVPVADVARYLKKQAGGTKSQVNVTRKGKAS